MKARRIGTTLRKELPALPHVAGAMLLTRPAAEVPPSIRNARIRGVRFCTLKDWRAAAGADGGEALVAHEVRRIARSLKPQATVSMDDSLRRLGEYVNLELKDAREDGAHRIYSGTHSITRDRVVLHLYDASATGDRVTVAHARRHFDTLRSLQLCPWAPRVQDSLQDVPRYRGELSSLRCLIRVLLPCGTVCRYDLGRLGTPRVRPVDGRGGGTAAARWSRLRAHGSREPVTGYDSSDAR